MPRIKQLPRLKCKILKKGKNPNCIHQEEIVGYIGTCSKCGQVRQYPDWEMLDDRVYTRVMESEIYTRNDRILPFVR
jgi:hypothetical protein